MARVTILAWAYRVVDELRAELADSELDADDALDMMIEALQGIRDGKA